MSFPGNRFGTISQDKAAGLDEVGHQMSVVTAESPTAPLISEARTHLARQYRYAAARLASDHAERRLQQSLLAFVQSLDATPEHRTSLAESLSRRLADLRQPAPPAPSHRAAADIRLDDNARRAA